MAQAKTGKTALIVDDDPGLCDILRELVGELARVEVCLNWTAARARLAEKRYDLVLLDVYLPDAEILEPLREIRRIDADYPVILMSGNVDRDDNTIDLAMRLGVNRILGKPFDFKGLLEAISEYL